MLTTLHPLLFMSPILVVVQIILCVKYFFAYFTSVGKSAGEVDVLYVPPDVTTGLSLLHAQGALELANPGLHVEVVQVHF